MLILHSGKALTVRIAGWDPLPHAASNAVLSVPQSFMLMCGPQL